MIAIEHGNVETAKLLLQAGCLTDIHSDDGCCALVRAANYNREDCVLFLLKHGARINISSRNNGNTALHKACEKGFHRLAFLLISRKASQSATNKRGDTPSEVAAKHGHKLLGWRPESCWRRSAQATKTSQCASWTQGSP